MCVFITLFIKLWVKVNVIYKSILEIYYFRVFNFCNKSSTFVVWFEDVARNFMNGAGRKLTHWENMMKKQHSQLKIITDGSIQGLTQNVLNRFKVRIT